MRLVDTAEGPTDPVGELVSAEQSLRLDYLAFAVDPLGLYRTLRQGTIRTPASLPLSLTSRLWAVIQPLKWWPLCQEALFQIKSRAFVPPVGSSRSTIQETAWLWRSPAYVRFTRSPFHTLRYSHIEACSSFLIG